MGNCTEMEKKKCRELVERIKHNKKVNNKLGINFSHFILLIVDIILHEEKPFQK